MAVSGSKNFSITGADIINSALRKIGEFDAAEDTAGADTKNALLALNLLVKGFSARGADLFIREEVTLFLQPGNKSYSLGSSASGNATTSFTETTLSAAEASGQTVIGVTSSTGMTAADVALIKMDDESLHVTTIVTVDSPTQITITTATDDDAASGNKVYAFTTRADLPQKILYAFRRDVNNLDTEVTIIGENEYQRQSNKASEGPPVEIFYRKGVTTGELFVWPVDGGSTWDKLVYIAQVLPDDFDATANNPEFPIEWGETLVYQLASRIAPEYGLPRLERALLASEAEFLLSEALAYDTENANVVFVLGDDD